MTLLKCLAFLASSLPLAAGIAESYRQLQQFEITTLSEAGPLPRIIPLLAEFKRQLRAVTAAHLAHESNPRRLKAALEAALAAEGIPVAAIDDRLPRRPYGQIHRVDVLRPPEEPALLAVTFHLQLAHGIDSSFTLYREGAPIFERDHNAFAETELDAQELSPPQFSGGRMLLAAASGGHRLLLQLFQLPANGLPRLFFQREFEQQAHQVALDPDGIRFEQLTFSYDINRGCCESFPLRLFIQADRVTRSQPIGFNPRQFLEAWFRSPWEDAAILTDPGNRAKLRARHAENAAHAHYSAPARCDDLAKLWQVTLNNDAYYLIERTGTWHFRLRDVRSEPTPGCEPDEQYQWRRTMFEAPLEP